MDEQIKAYLVLLKKKMLGYWKAFTELLSHNKFIFFIIIPLFLLAKFRDLATQFLVWKSDKDVEADKKQNDILENQVKAANNEANTLIKHAEDTAANQPKADVDWNKK